MTKKEIIVQYIKDLYNLALDSPARTSRILDLQDELEKCNTINKGCSRHLRGDIIFKDDTFYAECKKCGNLY